MNNEGKSKERILEQETGQTRLISENWGGKREGAGRRRSLPKAAGGRKNVTFYLSKDEESYLRTKLADYRNKESTD